MRVKGPLNIAVSTLPKHDTEKINKPVGSMIMPYKNKLNKMGKVLSKEFFTKLLRIETDIDIDDAYHGIENEEVKLPTISAKVRHFCPMQYRFEARKEVWG